MPLAADRCSAKKCEALHGAAWHGIESYFAHVVTEEVFSLVECRQFVL